MLVGPLLIGPEGDFSLDEVTLAESSGYSSISLGDYRLRTETAALLAVFHASIAWGNLGFNPVLIILNLY